MRQRMLARAIHNMGGPLSNQREEASTTPVPSPTPPPVKAPPIPEPDPESLGAADKKLRKAVKEMAVKAKKQDYFERLGLPRSATREQVKQGFFVLAKQFHPDRFATPSLADLGGLVKDLFSLLNEAYETLQDDLKREEYLDKIQQKKGPSAEDAAIAFKKAESCLKSRDYVRAKGLLEEAVAGDPKPEHVASLAWCLIAGPLPDKDRAKSLVVEALKDPNCDRAFYVAGVLAREDGEIERAEKMFRAAMRVNPKHMEAEREIRLIEMRRQKEGDGKKGKGGFAGFFSKKK
jgi:curved DNA-binding protein CbpA